MTASDVQTSAAGASSHAAQMWGQTNWPHIEAEVKRLQARIAKRCRNRHHLANVELTRMWSSRGVRDPMATLSARTPHK